MNQYGTWEKMHESNLNKNLDVFAEAISLDHEHIVFKKTSCYTYNLQMRE
jgi:hypothetical protein